MANYINQNILSRAKVKDGVVSYGNMNFKVLVLASLKSVDINTAKTLKDFVASGGKIVVIGGLIETRKVDSESKTPLLGDIPLVGELFKNKSKGTVKKELVIMLKPVVVGQDTWNDQLKEARALLVRPESMYLTYKVTLSLSDSD